VRRRRTSLAVRISLLGVGIAVLTAVLAGALAAGLIRNSGSAAAHRAFNRLADVAQAAASRTSDGAPAQARLRTALRGLNVRSGVIRADGTLRTAYPIVEATIDHADITNVLAGRSVTAARTVQGSTVFVAARPVGRGGIVLVQRRADATASNERAVRRIIIALLIAGGLAIVLGLLVAWRLARPLRRTAGAAHALAAGHRDVTLPAEGPAEVVEVSEAVNALAGALRQSEARQREFLLSVSHDLRTPLTAIEGYAESLADGVVPAEQTAHVGAVVLGEAKRLERLVGDLLDLARLGAQDFRVELVPVELGQFVAGTARVWQARCAAHGVLFRLDTPAAPVWTTTDAGRLRQVLDGLFDNALRVTPAGAPIVLAARADRGAAVVEVRDGGPGLRPEDLPVAFEQGVLYERYRGIRQVGTGLGLAIVHGLVQRLGATIEAGAASEGGARFTVRLPPAAATS
jgi:two-component system sensor histidine kinase BaeS